MVYSKPMVLRNLKNNQVICQDLKICQTVLDKLLGLINQKNPRNLMFQTRYGIHTFFLKEPIDVLVLSDNLRVVKIRRSLKPGRLFFWQPRYRKVLELPQGAILKFRVSVGDTLSIT